MHTVTCMACIYCTYIGFSCHGLVYICTSKWQQWTGVGQPVNEFFTFLGEGKVPWDTYAQLLYRQEYCSSHSNAVTYHLYMHACEWNLSVSLCIDIYGLCVHEQLKGESGCNCKK